MPQTVLWFCYAWIECQLPGGSQRARCCATYYRSATTASQATPRRRRPSMRDFRRMLFNVSPVGLAILLVVAAGGESLERATVGADGYNETVSPFIQRHCLACHGPETAKAGYRIDTLGTDFSTANVAERWKEVLDRIQAGEMPPDGRPRPDAKRAAAVAAWVNKRLRDVELAARDAGGRISMRRLNRDEYANTVRDLLKLDERIVRPLIEELPADGQAEGFDRLGAALFFDQTQLERSLAVATQLAARAIVTQRPRVNHMINRFEIQRLKPAPDRVPVFPGFQHTIPRGATARTVHPTHIEIIQGGPTYQREYAGWGVVAHFAISRVVTQDGYYRFRIRAKVDNRGRSTPNRFRLRYALKSPIQVEQEVPLDPSGVTEAVLFLRGPVNGEVKGPQVFNMLWESHGERHHPRAQLRAALFAMDAVAEPVAESGDQPRTAGGSGRVEETARRRGKEAQRLDRRRQHRQP